MAVASVASAAHRAGSKVTQLNESALANLEHIEAPA